MRGRLNVLRRIEAAIQNATANPWDCRRKPHVRCRRSLPRACRPAKQQTGITTTILATEFIGSPGLLLGHK